MFRRLLGLLPALLALFLVAPVHAQTAPCQFVLGFKTLHDAIPSVGDCTENQHEEGPAHQESVTRNPVKPCRGAFGGPEFESQVAWCVNMDTWTSPQVQVITKHLRQMGQYRCLQEPCTS